MVSSSLLIFLLSALGFVNVSAQAEFRAREGWRRLVPESALDWAYWSDEDLVKELLSEGLTTFRCQNQRLESVSATNSGSSAKLTYDYSVDGRLMRILAEINGESSCRKDILPDNQDVDTQLGTYQCRLVVTSAATECCVRGRSCTDLIPASVRGN